MNTEVLPGDEATFVGLTVAMVASRVGVAPATLRTWERRYGMSPSQRSEGGHRRYCSTDIVRLEIMRRLVLSGMPAGDAARAALESKIPDVSMISPVDIEQIVLRVSEIFKTLDCHTTSLHPGGGAVLSIAGSNAIARGLSKAASSLDSESCNQIITQNINEKGVVWTWENLISKVICALGERWAKTGQGIEAEHILSESIIGQMKLKAEQLLNPVNSRPIILASAPGELHTLPQYVVAAALAERRIRSRVLGARVPYDSLLSSIEKLSPAAVLIWAQFEAEKIPADFQELEKLRPAPTIFVAGPGWSNELPRNFKKVNDLTSTVTALGNVVGF